jgi:aspartate carbamoyltransferase regulatory subunit
MNKELKVSRIENGTVIDHLPGGTALKVVKALGLRPETHLILAMNVESGKSGRKDIVKIEDRFLSKDDTDRISLIAPNATINIIKGEKVTGKRQVLPPSELVGMLSCPNKNCITNAERCQTHFTKAGSGKYACRFCERRFSSEELGL